MQQRALMGATAPHPSKSKDNDSTTDSSSSTATLQGGQGHTPPLCHPLPQCDLSVDASRSAIPTTSRKPPSELERSWRPVYYPLEHRGTIVWEASSLRDCRFIIWKVYLTHGNGFCDGLPHTHPVTGRPVRSRCISGFKDAAKKCRKSVLHGKPFIFSYEFSASEGTKLPIPRKVDGSPVPERHVHIFNHDPAVTDEDLDEFDDESIDDDTKEKKKRSSKPPVKAD
ncbi:hypothetical protein BC829DRAFT_409176 [Chytridium lagenaria]|nr:hypothetical protein BC829DRAFT_409176 [Chytridium lagenaria]